MRRMTLAEARALVVDWKAQWDEQQRQPNAAYFSDVDADGLIRMAETGRKLDGKRMTKREYGCFVERWCEVFGDLPPSGNRVEAAVQPAIEPMPAYDTMLRMPDIERLTGLSKATIKRMVHDGRFPKPMRVGLRAKGWLARDVRTFIETLDEQRRRPRQ